MISGMLFEDAAHGEVSEDMVVVLLVRRVPKADCFVDDGPVMWCIDLGSAQ